MVTPATNPPDTKPTQQPLVVATPEQAPNTTPPAKTPDPTPAAAASAPVVELSRDQRIMQELELRFIQIKELGDTSYFSHEGVCRKCGWHTMEHNGESAASLMSSHVVRHWKDVAPQIK